MKKFNFENLPENLKSGTNEIIKILDFSESKDATPVYANEIQEKTIGIEFADDKIIISYNKKVEFFRLLSMLESVKENYTETPRHENLSYMADQSRNAVFNMQSAKRFALYLAALGYNELQLYTEDTYEIEGEPYFGHLRGRWTKKELREYDAYCDMLGIELVPCIQTLAHLERMFVWPEYKSINDKGNVLLVGEEKTYELIEKMFVTCKECFKSKKINIGLDEAHDLGLGKYLDRNGFERRYDIMAKHLNRVLGLCKKYDYEPMMWSDMYFRLAFGGSYYSETGSIPQEIIDTVAEDVTLVYWDYYTTDEKKFENMVRNHKAFKNKTAFAGGVQKWGDFVAIPSLTFDIEGMHIDKCIESGITDIMTTGWGDNGAEAPHFSILPGLVFYAEKCFIGDIEKDYLDKRFEDLAKIPMLPFELMGDMDYPQKPVEEVRKHYVYSKFVLYSDVLCGMFNKHILRDEFCEHYKRIADTLADYTDNKNFGYIVDMTAKLATVNMYKSILPHDIRTAYENGDKKALADIASNIIPEAVEAVDELLKAYVKMWNYESRPFGLETHQIRLGGLKQRLECVADRLLDYAEGRIEKIEELEQPLLYADSREEGDIDDLYPKSSRQWSSIVTPCIM